MAVAFDAVGPGVNAAAVSSFSWTHTPVGTPTAVGVGVSWYDSASGPLVITYGGATMTSAVSLANGILQSETFGKANPASGAQTVAGSWTGGGSHYPIGSSISVTGSDTTTCFSNTTSSSGTGTTITASCVSAAGELVMDTCVSNGGTPTLTVGAGQTQRWNASNSGLTGAGSTEGGAASVTMSWSSSASNPYVQTAASFKDAGGGGGGGATSALLLLPGDLMAGMDKLGANFQ